MDSLLSSLDESLINYEKSKPQRGHLGFSQIGGDDRKIWLQFRFSWPDEIDARVHRIFRLGNLLEQEVIELISKVPCVRVLERDPETGRQWAHAYLGGHFSGSMDAVIKEPSGWSVLEIKSASDKRFKEFKKVGLEKWNTEYAAQVQAYLGASGLPNALFVVYNKDTSELAYERVKAEKTAFAGYLAKAERIITTQEIPAGNVSESDIEAKWMKGETKEVYFGRQLPPSVNCRNCRFSRPVIEANAAKWECIHDNVGGDIHIQTQRTGCSMHNWLPSLVPADMIGKYPDCVKYRTKDGLEFWNAEGNASAIHTQVYSSRELYHLSRFGLNKQNMNDEMLQKIRTYYEGRIIG